MEQNWLNVRVWIPGTVGTIGTFNRCVVGASSC